MTKNWLGCRRILSTEPLPDDDGGHIDRIIRDWIQNNRLENLGALFKPEFWNVSER